MIIEGCPRGNDQVSRKACEGCEYLVVDDDESVDCMLQRSRGSSSRGGRRLPRSGIDLSKQPFHGEDQWVPPPPAEGNETPMASQDDGEVQPKEKAPPGNETKGKEWKRMFLDEKLEAVEDSIVEHDPTTTPENPGMMDVVERSIEGTWASPSDEAEESPPETSPETGEPSMEALPALPPPPEDPILPVNPPADDLFLNPDELTDPFGRLLPRLPDETDDESGPRLP